MHNLEPHFKWRLEYQAENDDLSPFYGRTYSEFEFSTKIYNYFIHPQWDDIGSETLYVKILYAHYANQYAIIELIGEWNDCIQNDVMILKDSVVNPLLANGICKFIFIGENVLNFHGEDDCYYEEWYEDISEEDGWICFMGFSEHVEEEMKEYGIANYVHMGDRYFLNWRPLKPEIIFDEIQWRIEND